MRSSSGAVMRKKSTCLGLEGLESALQKESDSSTSCCQVFSCFCRASSAQNKVQFKSQKDASTRIYYNWP